MTSGSGGPAEIQVQWRKNCSVRKLRALLLACSITLGSHFYLSGLLCPKGLNLKVLSNGSMIVLQVRGYNISPIASLEGGGLETTGSLSIRVRYRGKF